MFAHAPKPIRFAKTRLLEYEEPVNPHLAYDLSQLDELRKQGKPISQSNVESLYYDGDVNVSFDLPLDQQRGVDINDMWTADRDSSARRASVGVGRVDVNPVK